MTAKKINELSAKTPVSTDVIPVADPTTGVAGKSTIAQIMSASGNALPPTTGVLGERLLLAANLEATDYELRGATLTDGLTGVPTSTTSYNLLGVTACERIAFQQGTAYTNLTTLQSDDLIALTNYSNTQSLWVRNFPALETISFRALMLCQAVNIYSNPSLILLSLPTLMKTYNFNVYNCPSLQTITWNYLSEIGLDLNVYNCPMLDVFFLPTALKSIGGNVNFSGNGMRQANVDIALERLAGLDGNNGRCLWGAGLTCNISGGTNGSPSATGLAAKAILVARGCTVTHN